MPDRLLPSQRGIIDGFTYMTGAFYIFHGFSWFALYHPGRLAGIPWFHESLTDDIMGWWFVLGGLSVILGELFCRIKWVRTIVLNLSVMIPLLPGLIFMLAWMAGYYPRGILVASLFIGFATLCAWLTVRSMYKVHEDAEEIRKMKSLGG